MEGKTYLEILAENDEDARQEFDPNAKDLLVANIHEYEEDISPEDNRPDELEDQTEFQKPQGSHQQAAGPAPPASHEDKTKLSVRYDKDVYTQVVNIDSRFRVKGPSGSTNFLFRLPKPIKNVISVRVSSIELPNTFYNFSFARGNTTFQITMRSSTTSVVKSVVIADGNYDAMSLTLAVQNAMNALSFVPLGSYTFSVKFDPISGLTTILCTTSTTSIFDLNFQYGIYSNRTYNNGLGYFLGFRQNYISQTPYAGKVSYTSESIIDTTDCNYVFLSLDPDWKVVIHTNQDSLQLFSFAKIIMNVPKFTTLYDNGANTVTKEHWLKQPTNIVSIPVRLSDPYDQDIDLNGMDFSFSLEIKEVLNAALYETMRN